MNLSYSGMVESFGHQVLAFETTGHYQGDHWALLKDDADRFGFMNFGYGSCSGCDHLEGVFDYADELWEDSNSWDSELSPLGVEKWDEFCKVYEAGIRWFDTPKELVHWMTDDDGLELQWYGSDDEFQQDVLPKFISLAVV